MCNILVAYFSFLIPINRSCIDHFPLFFSFYSFFTKVCNSFLDKIFFQRKTGSIKDFYGSLIRPVSLSLSIYLSFIILTFANIERDLHIARETGMVLEFDSSLIPSTRPITRDKWITSGCNLNSEFYLYRMEIENFWLESLRENLPEVLLEKCGKSIQFLSATVFIVF